MNFVKALNAISSQLWAIVLVMIGVGTFIVATHVSAADARTAIISAGTGIVGGALVMFRQQATTDTSSHSTTTANITTTKEQ